MAILQIASVVGRHSGSTPQSFTFYVDPTAAGGGNGSFAAPWNTAAQITSATFTPGQSVGFKRGTTLTGTFTIAENGNSNNRIVLGAYGAGADPILDANGANAHTISITGDYVTVEDLDIRNAGTDGGGGERSNISFDGATNGLVQRCRLANGQIGVRFVNSSTNGRATECVFDANSKMTVNDASADNDYGAHAVFIGQASHNCEIDHCTSSGHVHTSTDYGFDGSFVEIFGCNNCLVHHNSSIEDLTFVEIGKTGGATADDNQIYYNLVTRSTTIGGGNGSGVVTRGASHNFGPCLRTIVDNNTMRCQGTSTDSSCINVGGTASTDILVTARNNILVCGNNAIWVGASGQNNTTMVAATYNVYSGNHRPTVGTGSTNTSTPGWVNAAAGDYHLTSGATARNTGTSLGYTADLDDLPIVGTPDRGCYEFQ